jgi:hypothetical protein
LGKREKRKFALFSLRNQNRHSSQRHHRREHCGLENNHQPTDESLRTIRSTLLGSLVDDRGNLACTEADLEVVQAAVELLDDVPLLEAFDAG